MPATYPIAALFSVPANNARDAAAHVHEILDGGAEMIGREDADAIGVRVVRQPMFITVALYKPDAGAIEELWSAHETEADALAAYREHVDAGAYTASVAMVLHSTDY